MDERTEIDDKDVYAKVYRVLSLYDNLNKGYAVNKKQVAADFSVSEKTIQRDIDDLRAYLEEESVRGK